ncbi:MAG TPA: UDP-N-acetylmuramoyl-L-alanine--D-glutamate ligase, partial [Desulfosarcina sp.]|nr:UDP-N-acetylmuramoyl-L-alanine--D-glutamate ligase [Desulfosarcina sp.]
MNCWTVDNLKSRAVTVVGLGRSGLAAARFCRRAGARVTVSETGAVDRFAAESETLERAGVKLEFGPHRETAFTRADLIVLSPGVPHTIPPLEAAQRRGIPVMGEMELAARFIREPIAAVTGTNGKTTTTELLGAMLAASGRQVFVGGNIGKPLIEYVEAATPADWLVVEVSSFQLDTTATFRPRIGCLLNISDDHLDRYPDLTAYAAAKWRLFRNQTAADTAILNAALPSTGKPDRPLAARVLYFNGAPVGQTAAACLKRNRLSLNPGGEARPVEISWSALPLVGRHNEENIEAAALAALTAGATAAGIRQAVTDFKGLPHRVHFVREVGGVRYYDDSKATNVDAVARALDSFTQPVVLIMGGRDKGGSYQALEARLRRHVRQL